MKNDISELMTNQKHMLEAIKYLHEQIEDIFKKAKNDKTDEVDNIIESQAMIDKLIIKNCDDILLIKKTKEENIVAIKHLERQIEKLGYPERCHNHCFNLLSFRLHFFNFF